jgi:PAS domain S-box-containing protein
MPQAAGPVPRVLVFAGEREGYERIARELERSGAGLPASWVSAPGQGRGLLAGVPCAAVVAAAAQLGEAADLLAEVDEVPTLLIPCAEADAPLLAEALRHGAVLWREGAEPGRLRELLGRCAARALHRDRERRLRQFELGQMSILERIALGAPLPEVLERIVRLIEGQDPDRICSILLLDREAGVVRHGAAPNLPAEYMAAIDGSAIGPSAGSCGAAAFTRERVIVEDIATHRNWVGYRDLALPHGLRACWSSPIFSPAREVLGTFAVYYREPRGPSEDDLRWVDGATHLAALAIQGDASSTALRRSEARYRQLLDTTLEGAVAIGADGRLTYANRRAQELLGDGTPADIGAAFADLVDPAEREQITGLLARRRAGLSERCEIRLKADGHAPRWAILATSPIIDEAGIAVGLLGMVTDITERRRAEDALRRSEKQHRAIFDRAAIGMALVDGATRPLRLNPACEAFLGRAAEELRSISLSQLTHPEEKPLNLERLRLRRGPYQSEMRFLRRDGTVAWARVTVSLLEPGEGDEASAVVMIEDIGESKRLAEEVRSAETIRSLIFDSVNDVLFFVSVDPDGRFRLLSANDAFLRSTGLRLHQVVGRRVDEIIPEPSLSLVLDKYRRAIFEGRAVRWDEVTEYPAGTRFGEVTVTPVFESSGRCKGLVGSVHDITERTLAQEKIAEQAALLDHAQDAILLRTVEGVVRYWNQGAMRLYGWSQTEAVGKHITELIYRGSAGYAEAQRRVMEEGRWEGEIVQYDKHGRELTVEGSWTLVRDRQGRPQAVLTINTDISEKHRLRAQVALGQRMDSLGALAGGIAHDFNNILAAVMGSIVLAQGYVSRDHRAQRNLAVAMSACARAEDLVRRILTFSRHREPHRTPMHLRPVVEEALQLLRSSLPAMIEVRSTWATEVPVVSIDPGQIHQVIMNLGINAAAAMGERGVLSVRLEPILLEGALEGAFSRIEPGRYARLSVDDTGTGIDAPTLARIFDPFFTTRVGKGTGLGLFAVQTIVKDHAGGMTIATQPGRGSSFSVYLPESTSAAVAGDQPRPHEPATGHTERLLLVDDESSLLAIAAEILRGYGYRVDAYADPVAALTAFRATPDDFDAVLTDFAMPGMTGLELARRIRDLRPGMPVLLASGHLTPADEREAQLLGVQAVLSKPGAAHEMLTALEWVLKHAEEGSGTPDAGR